jgi:tryptophan synthase alpha chain
MALQNKKLFIPFFSAGFPTLDSTNQILKTLEPYADYIEIGLPHSDALADGPVIQNASHISLQNGMSIQLLLQQLSNRKSLAQNSAKLILFSYLNPILSFGLEQTCKAWKDIGGSCILVPDLPLEEALELKGICEKRGLSLILLAAPTSTPERIKKIVELSSEFIYLVSVTGVTGVRTQSEIGSGKELQPIIQQIKEINPAMPVVIGFGISNSETALAAINQGSDGVVIGSAIVKLAAQNDLKGIENLAASVVTALNA